MLIEPRLKKSKLRVSAEHFGSVSRYHFGMRLIFAAVFSILFVAPISAQTAGTTRTLGEQLQQLPHLEHSLGATPTAYVPASKNRALAYQRSLEAALPWFDQQLGIHVPMNFYVLDQASYESEKDSPSWPVAYSDPTSNPNIIVFPSRIEEIAGSPPQEKLAGEYILFHEAGHNYAAALHIASNNAWVNELIANLFMAEYIHARRPDLKWTMDGPSSRGIHTQPHYTSLRDLDYVYYPGVGALNYAWYQYELEELARFLIADQSLPVLVKKLQAEFPAAAAKQETLEQITAHLDHIRPGSEAFLKPLYGPSILAHISPSACPVSPIAANGHLSVIAVQNDSSKPLAVTSPDGKTEVLAPATWDGFMLRKGEVLKISDNRCLTGMSEPSLALVD